MEDMSKIDFHILVIDDNEDILFVISAMLKNIGYTVSTRDNVNNIEAAIMNDNPHIIIMDMHLSGADGCDICRELKAKEEFKHIPILMISADPIAKNRCTEAGADHFIEKPFEMKELIGMAQTFYDRFFPQTLSLNKD